jgi:hypothetical protein
VRDSRVLVVAALALMVASPSADVTVRSFEQDALGAAPAGFTFAAARLANAGRWVIRAEGSDRYVAHLGEGSRGQGFALALLDAQPPSDLRLSARIKLAEGARVGGLVWGYHNPENFYAVSLDLNAQNVAMYRVARGNRIRLEVEDDLELDPNAWHVLRVELRDSRISVSIGGIGVMRARERSASASGRAGVWSAGQATTWFDDVQTQEARADRR